METSSRFQVHKTERAEIGERTSQSEVIEVVTGNVKKFHGPNAVFFREEGFTLLEMMAVVIVMGTLSAIAVPKILSTLTSAKLKVVKDEILEYDSVLGQFAMDTGRYPTSEEGIDALYEKPEGIEAWNGPYARINFTRTDPWGHEWVYRNPSVRSGQRDYDLCSAGPDGKGEEPEDRGMICNP